MKDLMIDVENVTFRYDRREQTDALSSVSFKAEKGKWLSVIGNNGAGKSTLAALLIGLIQPSQGTIRINGVALDEESKWTIRRSAGIVFQNPDNQFIGATVQDDVAFGLENLNVPADQMRLRVTEALETVGMLNYRTADPTQLSGGQKQRVAIAGVLALRPDLLILDEAFVMLDPRSRRELLATLKRLKTERDLTILSITHDMNEAAASDRILVLKQGHVARSDTPAHIFSEETELAAPFSERLRRLLLKKGRRAPESYRTESEMVQWLCD
ncbi:energy-coupling factor transporter ATPase [Sporolactobacillus nakayamae]|uniref:Energy-coupling factor transport system ATP-binding protein n=1 Tax=Sporolactobacillus nakayamae TaxID=269670 RepID=A0A1I2PIS3_9BACL|nr:energy-coupling factor transporter ATPase [Sporolactobacillus nakayamae]SFG15954.1 energy-coupling factor transport system ATP-binding protein [Sporolactobacillus nakayamae]